MGRHAADVCGGAYRYRHVFELVGRRCLVALEFWRRKSKMSHINPAVEMYREPRPNWDYFHAPLRAPGHAGVDLYARRGTALIASEDGIIHDAGFLNTGAGWGVEIWHPDREELTRYLHMDEGTPTVTTGQSVLQGDVIGSVGCTGICNSPHVHYEIRAVANYDPFKSGVSQGTPRDPIAEGLLTNQANEQAAPDEQVPVTVTLDVLVEDQSPYDVRDIVRLLQYSLNAFGMIDLTPGVNFDPVTMKWDGKHGPSTDQGVRDFQVSVGLLDDGVVGAATWTALLDY